MEVIVSMRVRIDIGSRLLLSWWSVSFRRFRKNSTHFLCEGMKGAEKLEAMCWMRSLVRCSGLDGLFWQMTLRALDVWREIRDGQGPPEIWNAAGHYAEGLFAFISTSTIQSKCVTCFDVLRRGKPMMFKAWCNDENVLVRGSCMFVPVAGAVHAAAGLDPFWSRVALLSCDSNSCVRWICRCWGLFRPLRCGGCCADGTA